MAKDRIAFLVIGTHGDNQPFVPLCRALIAQGFVVEYWAIGPKTTAFMRDLGIAAVQLGR
jgi:UDP:flavonoid glycosyltransferase YjiC (YdhE family)